MTDFVERTAPRKYKRARVLSNQDQRSSGISVTAQITHVDKHKLDILCDLRGITKSQFLGELLHKHLESADVGSALDGGAGHVRPGARQR